MKLLIFISIVASSTAQFPFDIASQKPWTGPIADHKIGIHPSDTAEVAAAKNQHLTAFQSVLSVLPEIPPQERYTSISEEQLLSAGRALQEKPFQQQVKYVPVMQTHDSRFHIAQRDHTVQTTPTIPTLFAEKIPRSPIGEVPEVHAARVAHLRAIEEARKRH